MNICIKTGADLWMDSQNCIIHCDAYFVPSFVDATSQTDGCFVFRHLGAQSISFVSRRPANVNAAKATCHFLLLDGNVYNQHCIAYLDSAMVIVAPYSLVVDRRAILNKDPA